MKKDVRIWADRELLDTIKERVPELRGLTYSGTVDYILRRWLRGVEKGEA